MNNISISSFLLPFLIIGSFAVEPGMDRAMVAARRAFWRHVQSDPCKKYNPFFNRESSLDNANAGCRDALANFKQLSRLEQNYCDKPAGAECLSVSKITCAFRCFFHCEILVGTFKIGWPHAELKAKRFGDFAVKMVPKYFQYHDGAQSPVRSTSKKKSFSLSKSLGLSSMSQSFRSRSAPKR